MIVQNPDGSKVVQTDLSKIGRKRLRKIRDHQAALRRKRSKR